MISFLCGGSGGSVTVFFRPELAGWPLTGTRGYIRRRIQSFIAEVLVACNIEIDSVTGTGQPLVEVDLIRLPLINTPLQRGELRSADLRTVSTVSRHPQPAKPLNRWVLMKGCYRIGCYRSLVTTEGLVWSF